MSINININKQSNINRIYANITNYFDSGKNIFQSETNIAEPGDLIFCITYYPNKNLKDELKGKNLKETIRFRSRPWFGFYKYDFSDWHVAIFFTARKRINYNRINIWMIHSTGENGVHIKQLTPRYFTNKGPEVRTRMEILQYEGVGIEQREKILEFANSKVGSDFDRSKWRHKMLPYAFGLRNKFHKQNQFSCQQLAMAAYAAAGIYFPHPYKAFPIFNIGRYLGHPLGHPTDRVDPRDPYLMDHHIYRDPRFVLKAAVYQDPNTDEIILQTENLKKYSWNEALREKYIKKGYLDP
jgi:hypothetical protein